MWVFTLEEEDPGSQGIVTDLLVKMTRPRWLIMKMIVIMMIMAKVVEDKSHFCFHNLLQLAGLGL